jgi:phosphonate transport system ATP-binding protein
MIRVSGLTKIYPPDAAALSRVSFRVEPGEFVVIMGRSGAGKSTLLRCLNRLVEPTEGRVWLDGHEISGASGKDLLKVRAEIGIIFQSFNLVKRLNVLENVLVGRLGHASLLPSLFLHFSKADRAIAEECLEIVGLRALAGRRADTLSGGEQQRVGIARALAQKPRVILADEPTASLDPELSRVIMDILKRVNEEHGITTIVSQHNVETALAYGRRVLALRRGELVFDGSVAEVTPSRLEEIYGAQSSS